MKSTNKPTSVFSIGASRKSARPDCVAAKASSNDGYPMATKFPDSPSSSYTACSEYAPGSPWKATLSGASPDIVDRVLV